MIEEGDTDIVRGELVDKVVGRPVKHHVRDLLHIRHCLLEKNENYIQIMAKIRSLKRRKAILRRSLVALEQQWQGQVWVPPSSSGDMSTHNSKVQKKILGTKEDIKTIKTECRALSRKLAGLELKRVFFVWRMQSVLYREMEAMMVGIEKYTNMDLVRETFETWKDVAEPWAYDLTVLEHMDIFRRVCQLGHLDRILVSWRQLVYIRKDFEERKVMFVIGRESQLLKDALAQWKVFRVMHHLAVMRRHMAGLFDSLRLRRICFMYWMKRTHRRLELQKRMTHCVFQCGMQMIVHFTVDDLLLMDTVSSSNAYTMFQSIREDIQHLKVAANLMRHRVRWNDLHGVVYTKKAPVVEYESDKYADREIHESLSENIRILQSEILRLQQEEQDVRREIEETLEDVARDARKHKVAVKNLAEYEHAASELEKVQQKLHNQMKSMAQVTKTKEGEYLEKVALVSQLEEVHHSLCDALLKAKADVISHSKKLDQTCDEIREWKTKIRQHSRSAMPGKHSGTTYTSTVMLEDSHKRLRMAETRLEKLQNAQYIVRDVQNKASASEREVRMELENALKDRDEAQLKHETSQTLVQSIHTKVDSLEEDYGAVMLRIDRLVKYADELHKRMENAVEKRARLDATCDSLKADVQVRQESVKSLQQEIHRLEEDFKVTTPEQACTELSGETVSLPMSSGPISTRPYIIPGDRMLLQSARSYAILRHAKLYFSRWRRHANLMRDIVQKIYEAYTAQSMLETFVLWRHTIVSQQHMANNAHRLYMLSSGLKSWKKGKNTIKRHSYLIQSYQALASVKTKQHVLRAWRETVYVENAGSDAECRLKNQKLCLLFHFWRKETCQNMNLRIRYLEYCQAQDNTLLEHFFNRWRLATKQRRLLSRVFLRALDAWSVRLREEQYAANVPHILYDCMSVWSTQVHVSREERRLERLCLYMQEKHENRLSRNIVENWKRTMEESASLRVDIVDRLESRRIHDTLKDCFGTLKAFAYHRVSRKIYLRVAWTCDHPQRFAMSAWMRAVEKARQQRAIDNTCLKLRHALLVSKDNQQQRIRAVEPCIPAAMYTVASPPKRVLDPSHAAMSPADVSAISV